MSRAAAVGTSPEGERVNSGTPSACSISSMWRRMVGWVTPRDRAAADRLPCSSTARTLAIRSQETRMLIYLC